MSLANKSSTVPVVAVGASAGGLEALREMFSGYPGKVGMSFVVVQHLDPDHDSLMAQLLERYTEMGVTQAAGGERLEEDHIYVIPPGHGLAVDAGILRLTEFKDPRGLRRPIDDFFESLAADKQGQSACVILSGTGGDGSRGLRAIKEHGGLAVVQEPTTARYDGMPVSAIGTGLVDITLPPAQIIEALRNFFDRADAISLDEAAEASDHIDEMCAALREAVGHDFVGYKRSTLTRRIARRMQVLSVSSSEEYLERLRSDPGECQALFRDLLINVTRFFRDREEFDKLDKLVIDPMIARSRDATELRVWIAGCSSGEEAYSVAMLIAEAMGRHERRPYIQIFATDIDDKMLEIARHAVYPIAALADIPIDFQAGYLQIGADTFTIAPRIRDMVRFSSHNLVRDPPYSKIDLICCRNLLIYFDEDLQRQVLPSFHFSLNPGGVMFLGSSESIGRFEDLFSVVDQRARIFERRETHVRYPLKFAPTTELRRTSRIHQRPSQPNHRSLDLIALSRIAERHAPVSLLVDAEGTLLNNWGAVGRYLEFPDRREGAVNVIRQAKRGLSEIIGPMLREAVRSSTPKRAKDVSVETGFGRQPINIVVDPVGSGAFLVIFREAGALESADADDFEEYERGSSEMQYLQEELQSTRLRLRTTVEELETANEELKSSNEEMMSMNEELQSTNEELTTVNDELKAKIDQVTTANADLKNFFESTELAVVIVDDMLRVRSFTEAASSIFAINMGSVGTALAMIRSELQDDEYVAFASDASKFGKSRDYRTTSIDGAKQYLARILPYRLLDGSLGGSTLVFTEVTKILHLEEALAQERARLQMALDVARIGVWEYDPSSGATLLDETERALLGISRPEDGAQMDQVLARLPADDRDRVNSALRRAMAGTDDYDEVFRVNHPDGVQRWMHGLGRNVRVRNGHKFIGVTFDVTAERELLAERELVLREMNHRVKNLFAVISSLTRLCERHSTTIEEYSGSLRERIHALGLSHNLTMNPDGLNATLQDMIEVALKPASEASQATMEGPVVRLAPRQITPLAMILHEWATNAAKYGSFSVAEGHLTVTWSIEANSVTLCWEERGVSLTDTQTAGFGTKLIEMSARQLAGRATAVMGRSKFTRVLTFELDQSA